MALGDSSAFLLVSILGRCNKIFISRAFQLSLQAGSLAGSRSLSGFQRLLWITWKANKSVQEWSRVTLSSGAPSSIPSIKYVSKN